MQTSMLTMVFKELLFTVQLGVISPVICPPLDWTALQERQDERTK